VHRLEDEIVHVNLSVELLAHLACQRVGVAFGRTDLSARKLPHSGQVHAVGTPRDEE